MAQKPVLFIVIGAGDRGFTYSRYSKLYPDRMQLIAVADVINSRRKKFASEFDVNNEMVFESYEQVLAKPKFADAVIVATPDDIHAEPAKLAIEKGYAVLLEKPIANKLPDIVKLNEFNCKLSGFTAVCHVLRYTWFFSSLKRIIDSGGIGKVMSIEHIEGVGWWHQAHSYVRGNWADTTKTSPMILAKSCHDMDILLWLSGKHCRKVSSFGSLSHFKPENAPANSSLRCTDNCGAEPECPYSAKKLYLNMEIKGWPVSVITEDMTFEGRLRAINEGPYGKCVYHSGNNAVDHQVVSLEFEDGVTASFTMSAFTTPGRKIRIMGTMGELKGDEKKIEFNDFRNGKTEYLEKPVEEVNSGHGGGDFGLISAFIDAVQAGDKTKISSSLDVSVESHQMAFAAEQSRLNGKVVTLF